MGKPTTQRGRILATIIVISVLFVSAVFLWLYRTGRLGASADVRVDGQNRVTLTFDEVSLLSSYFGTYAEARTLYQAYGIHLLSLKTNTIYDDPSGYNSAVITNVSTLANGGVNLNRFIGPTSTPPNALVGKEMSNYGVIPAPGRGIRLAFVDPNEPGRASTTDSVRFYLSSTSANYHTSSNGLTLPGSSPSQGLSAVTVVDAFNEKGETLSTRQYGPSDTHLVEFSHPNIAAVEIKSGSTGLPLVGTGSRFVVDDITFTLPKTSATSSAALTANGTQFTQGQSANFTFTNTGQTTLSCPSPLVYTVSRDGTQVFASPGGRDPQTIEKGGQKTFTWNLKDSSGTVVAPGTYAVRVECANNVNASTQITVVSATPPAQPDGVLTTDKPTYKPGETIGFSLRNTGTTMFVCGPRGYRVLNSTGVEVYKPESIPALMDSMPPTNPGEAASWSWQQKNTAGTQVPDGTYTIEVSCGDLKRHTTVTITSQTIQTLDFTVTPSEGQAPLTVVAEYKGTVDPTTLTWDFGDGSPALTGGALRSHVYPVAGTYTVTLRSGSTGVGTKQVVVTAPATPPADPGTPSLSNTSGTGPTLTNTSSPTAIASLVSTGGNLVVNLAVATLLSLLAAWLILRPKRQA